MSRRWPRWAVHPMATTRQPTGGTSKPLLRSSGRANRMRWFSGPVRSARRQRRNHPGRRPGFISTRDLLAASGPGIDAFSYHHYGAVSQRCAPGQATPEAALSEAWLASTGRTLALYRSLRDEFAPDKPIWLTETAETACGGNPWASTFLDTFRYLDQLGRLAKAGVQMVAHNTLAASDYGLLDEKTLRPRPTIGRRCSGAG